MNFTDLELKTDGKCIEQFAFLNIISLTLYRNENVTKQLMQELLLLQHINLHEPDLTDNSTSLNLIPSC